MADDALKGVRRQTFANYLEFRRQLEETRALSFLLEADIDEMKDEVASSIHAEFIRLDLSMILLSARTLKEIFEELARSQIMPLSAREMFAPDVSGLRAAQDKLQRPEYKAKRPEDLERLVNDALALAEPLMAETVALPEFDQPKPPPR